MALGGTPIGWDESTPAGSESVGQGDDRIRSAKTTIRNALDAEHFWHSSSSTAGAHRPGSARAFFGTQSRVSASNDSYADGRLMVTSDTTRLFGVNSEGTALLGAGPFTPSFGSYVALTLPQRRHIAMETGVASPDGSGRFVVSFPSAFSDPPFILGQSLRTYNPQGMIFSLWYRSASGFSGVIYQDSGGTLTDADLIWLAIGHRAL